MGYLTGSNDSSWMVDGVLPSREGVLIVDTDGSIISFNEVAHVILGVDLASLVGKSLVEVFQLCEVSSDGVVAEQGVSLVQWGDSDHVARRAVWRVQKGGSSPLYIDVFGQDVDFSGQKAIAINFFDVSLGIREQLKVSERAAHLRNVVTSLDDIIFKFRIPENLSVFGQLTKKSYS